VEVGLFGEDFQNLLKVHILFPQLPKRKKGKKERKINPGKIKN